MVKTPKVIGEQGMPSGTRELSGKASSPCELKMVRILGESSYACLFFTKRPDR
jgi:hypothetical protein